MNNKEITKLAYKLLKKNKMGKKEKTYKTWQEAIKHQKYQECTVFDEDKKKYVNIKDWPHFKDPFVFNYRQQFVCELICSILGAVVDGMVGFVIGALLGFLGYIVMFKIKYDGWLILTKEKNSNKK